ncbi:putative membrane protein [Streptococcus infantarius subsp. infantarius]|nr:putative membrane protein [Streptococcus infantarius subsp. infantarius]MCO4536162.1 putative membrane protein [Streptococcus infantarius subsp. infantarius]MCO4537150.1 putative membrane protein [Streptococcus infantarius subsp. infantarius]MCO4539533.1 putative membrane protein [Streptococcus infantarius subsp. infantarius]MCO4558843.1 putative membrane protein [Streptococcus infantarius subsp. infantarius]
MKVGPRKPSLKRSVKARTTGKVKRQVCSTINPVYGKKGLGWVNNPKKATYNKVYNKTTFSVFDLINENTIGYGCGIIFVIFFIFIMIKISHFIDYIFSF